MKNRLYKPFLHSSNPGTKSTCKIYKNKLIHSLRIAKRLYYDKKLTNNKSNIKETWKILNSIINKKRTKSKMNSVFNYDGKEVLDPIVIANRYIVFSIIYCFLKRFSVSLILSVCLLYSSRVTLIDRETCSKQYWIIIPNSYYKWPVPQVKCGGNCYVEISLVAIYVDTRQNLTACQQDVFAATNLLSSSLLSSTRHIRIDIYVCRVWISMVGINDKLLKISKLTMTYIEI